MAKSQIKRVNSTVAPEFDDTCIVVDDGTREIPIKNKFGKTICTIYFRPADLSIIDRYEDFIKNLQTVLSPLARISIERDGTPTFDKDWQLLSDVENDLKRRINELFDMDEADQIFATRRAFSSVNGTFFCINVFDKLGEYITNAINREAALSQARVEEFLTPSNNRAARRSTPAVPSSAKEASADVGGATNNA